MYLLLLAAAWLIVLVPPLVQRFAVARPAALRDPLAALARRQGQVPLATAPSPPARPTATHPQAASTPDPLVPRSAFDAEQRRRMVAAALGLMSLVSLMVIPALGVGPLVLHIVIDAALIGYGYAWWRRNQMLDAATASVVALSSLRPAAANPSPIVVTGEFRRVVNG
ncbi:MAG: hypothetical protein OEW42_10770 [Acidimicrobiia bacterium]|nr:hypothetical protein [Acidimicrobiia bacterium]MDH5237233.1 hypothetical protein [Acidimicrobiia bacterium]